MNPARVLIVDDNSAFLKAEVDLLSENFVVVGTAVNGRSAVSAADTLKPDVVVLDLSLGDMTGFEVARRLKSLGSQARVVFFSIHEGDEFVEAAVHLGASGYVFKSHTPEDLTRAVLAASQGKTYFPSQAQFGSRPRS